MTPPLSTNFPRVLAIAPGTRGFGFAVFEGQDTLVDWGVKSVNGRKNALAKVEAMISHYQPRVMILENASAEDSRRSTRIRTLVGKIAALAPGDNIKVKLFSRTQVNRVFFPDGQGTRHALAEILAARFPDELGFRLPPKRRAWMSDDYRMDIFEAVALALSFRLRKQK